MGKTLIEIIKRMLLQLRIGLAIMFIIMAIISLKVYTNGPSSIHNTMYFISFILTCILVFLIIRFGFVDIKQMEVD